MTNWTAAQWREYRARKRRRGVCLWCSAPAEKGKSLCRPHGRDNAQASRDAYPRAYRLKNKVRCGKCGKTGHNRRRCPR